MEEAIVLLRFLEDMGLENIRSYGKNATFYEEACTAREICILTAEYGDPVPLYDGANPAVCADVKWVTPLGSVIFRSRHARKVPARTWINEILTAVPASE